MFTALFSFIILVSALVFPSVIQAGTPQSDYEYQLTQYRRDNTEFTILKDDNQKNPTLDNQQKALQAARQTIISRDKAKITYIEVILNSIKSQKLTQDHVLQTEKELVKAQDFYRNQIVLAKNIITVEDLTNFTREYLKSQSSHQIKIIKSLAVNKTAILIRLQIGAKDAYNDLLPRINDKSLVPVSAGLTKITQLADSINSKILSNTNTIKSSEVTVSGSKTFYRKQTEALSQIQNLQVDLINTLLDLEKNYAN
jgi:hypothetical protein